MRKWLALVPAFFAAMFALVACTGETTDELGASPPSLPRRGSLAEAGASDGAATGIPCDVASVLATRCGNCHGAEAAHGSPFSLVTYEDVAPRLDRVIARAKDTKSPMPPSPAAPLATNELEALSRWASAGAPRSTEACSTGQALEEEKLRCSADVKIRPSRPYEVPSTVKDEYVCYGMTVKSGSKRHITALGAHIDDRATVHHVLVFAAEIGLPSEPTPCPAGVASDWKLLMGWAPGGTPVYLPDEAGFVQREGESRYVVQIHYNNARALSGHRDTTGFDLCTTDQLRPFDADAMATGSLAVTIPPRAKHTQTCRYTWGSGTVIPLASYPKIRVFSQTPHMHALGESMGTWVERPGSAPVPVGKPGPFDVDNQTANAASVEVSPGDVFRTTCRWNNTTDGIVRNGEGSDDEMCFNFLGYYPKVDDPAFLWVSPSAVPTFLFGCQETSE